MANKISAAEAVAKMHVAHVEQAESLGLAEEFETLYDHIEGLSLDRLAILQVAIAASLSGTTRGLLTGEDEPSVTQLFGLALATSSVVTIQTFVGLVLLERLGVDRDAVDTDDCREDFGRLANAADHLTEATVDHFAGQSLSSETLEAASAEFQKLVASGVPVEQAARQTAEKYDPKQQTEAPKATAGDVDLPTGFYL